MDLAQIDCLLNESRKAWEVSDYTASEERARKALDILSHQNSGLDSEEAARWWKMHTAYAYRLLGISLKDRGKFSQALECYQQSLQVSEECGDAMNSSKTLMNIGIIYEKRGDYPKALECFHRAYEVKVQTEDHAGTSKVLVNMAIVYRKLGKYAKALEYNAKALMLKEQIGDRLGESHVLNNIGLLHYDEGNNETALQYYNKALVLKEELGERLGVSTVLTNIAAAYCRKCVYKEALVFCNRALRLKEELGSSVGKAHVYEVLGNTYMQMGEVEKAEESLHKALDFAKENTTPQQEATVYKRLAELYRSTNEWDRCAYYLEQHYETEKAIINEPIARRIVELETEDIVRSVEVHYEIAKRDAERERIHSEELAQALSTVQKLNTELAVRNKELEALNEEKNHFLAMASNDMKNPLTSIKMFARLLLGSEIPVHEEVQQFASEILTNAKRMYGVVTNLLDIHAIEEGNLRLHPTRIDLMKEVANCISEHTPKARSKNVRINRESFADNVYIYADKNALQQILDNLLANAVKYSTTGKDVCVRIADSGSMIQIVVMNSGLGIKAEEQATLFRKFKKVTRHSANEEHSTGLGLVLVKQLSEAMGGKVWCESEYGVGATFIVELQKHTQGIVTAV